MARISPMILPIPEREVCHRQITDGKEVSDFWFRALDSTEQFGALALTNEKVKQYITGDKVEKTLAEPFPPVGGKALEKEKLTPELFQAVAFIWAMQSDVDKEGNPVLDVPYTFEELIALSLTKPVMWGEVMTLSAEVTEKNAEALKNASGAGTA